MPQNWSAGKLAVILHADIAGSTKLVQQDEHLTHERIQDTFRRFGDTITQYHGNVRELRGDALLAEFERASDAVTAALAFQKINTDYGAQLNDGIQPTARVGIAMGEIVIADNTLTGAGVVLAQRVEQLADPGGVCITGAIHEALPQRLPFNQKNLGEQRVKGFDEPIRIYRVELKSDESIPLPQVHHLPELLLKPRRLITAVAAIALVFLGGAVFWLKPWQVSEDSFERMAVTLPDKPSIAVLPFTNMSGNPEQEYFADGITEDLTTDLSKISGLFVVSRNSSFAYKGKSPDIRQVSKELGVKYVLEGSVRRSGDQIRINAQLIDGATGGHVWAERFDGSMANVFSLQDDVNNKIVTALKVNLTSDDRKRLDKIETSNPDAYDTLLRGLDVYQHFDRESNAQAREIFEQAIVLDANYARAYANVALTHASDVNFNWTNNREESIQLGLENAAKAVDLDASIPQIYLTRSILYLAQRRHDAAIEAGRRTIEVHPNYADGYAALAFVLSFSGQLEEALAAIHQAKHINPQYSYVYLAVEGRILFLLRRYEEAILVLEESAQRNPVFDRVQLNLAATYAQLGELDDAAWAVEEALAIRSDISLADEELDANYKRPEDLNHYIGALRKAGVPE